MTSLIALFDAVSSGDRSQQSRECFALVAACQQLADAMRDAVAHSGKSATEIADLPQPSDKLAADLMAAPGINAGAAFAAVRQAAVDLRDAATALGAAALAENGDHGEALTRLTGYALRLMNYLSTGDEAMESVEDMLDLLRDD